jgi:hypothetical protein
MYAYQSITHTNPSGPTSAMIGELHSSMLASRLNALRLTKLDPCGSSTNVPTRWPVGSVTKAARFQYSFGYARAVYSACPAAAV